jgi:hypothetical protein
MMRCRHRSRVYPRSALKYAQVGYTRLAWTVTHTAFATVPDQRCTASRSLALHRIRDTSDLFLALMGLDPGGHHFRKRMDGRVEPGHDT